MSFVVSALVAYCLLPDVNLGLINSPTLLFIPSLVISHETASQLCHFLTARRSSISALHDEPTGARRHRGKGLGIPR